MEEILLSSIVNERPSTSRRNKKCIVAFSYAVGRMKVQMLCMFFEI